MGHSRTCPRNHRSGGHPTTRSDECAHCGDDFIRRAEIGTMPGCLQYDHLAIRNTSIDVLTNFLARDDILAALKNERGNIDACQVASIVSREGNPCKGLGDVRVGSAETVG